MSREQRYANIATNISFLSQHYKSQVGAIIVNKSILVSTGINRLKTHPLQRNPHTNKPGFIHAELDAIIKSSYVSLNGYQMYIARVLKDNSFGLARPCKSCIEILLSYGINIVNYSYKDNIFIKEDINKGRILKQIIVD